MDHVDFAHHWIWIGISLRMRRRRSEIGGVDVQRPCVGGWVGHGLLRLMRGRMLRGGFERIAKPASHNAASQPVQRNNGTIDELLLLSLLLLHEEGRFSLPTLLPSDSEFIHSWFVVIASYVQAGLYFPLFVFPFCYSANGGWPNRSKAQRTITSQCKIVHCELWL